MHYYIDGYNMLFRLIHADDKLQSSRDQIIRDINKKVAIAKINVSIVFDATSQIGSSRTRTHFNELEILFTAEGETADEFILDEIKKSSKPRQETVVTSDKKLAQQVRRNSGHTESVETFILWLNRVYKNRLKQQKKQTSLTLISSPFTEQKTSKPEALVPPQIKAPRPKTSITPSKQATIKECTDYYEQVFEKEFEELLKNEKPKRTKKPTRQAKKNIKQPSPFDPPAKTVEASNQMDRWLKIFEERTNPSGPDSN